MKRFSGTYFDPALTDGRTQVEVLIAQTGLEFQKGEHTERWATHDVNVSIGGSSRHLLFFSKKQDPQLCFYLPWDRELKRFMSTEAPDEWKKDILHDRKREHVGQWLAGALTVAFIVGIVSIVYFRSAFSKPIVGVIPYRVEEALGDQFIKSMLPTHSRVKDAELQRSLERVLMPLRLAMPRRFQDFKVYMSNDSDLNAFALPGGHIIFNIGTLRSVNDASELLGVAAHELTHVSERHTMRNIVEGAGLFLVVQTMLGDMTGLIALLADQGSFVLTRSFSRSMENEADEIGMDLLLEARIDPRGMARFFQALIDKQNELGETVTKTEKALQFLSTHPDTDARIQNIESRYQALNADLKKKLDSDTPEFKKMKERLSKLDEDNHE